MIAAYPEADVDGHRPGEVVGGALQRVEAVLSRGLGAGLHVRLVHLDDVGAGLEEVEDLLAHGIRVGHPDRVGRPVVVVLRLLRHRERTRDGHLRLPARVRAQELQVANLDRMAPGHRPDHAGHGVGMPAAIEGGARVVDVNALEGGGEAVRVALAPHLAVGDDVEAGAFLVGDREPRRVVLGLLEVGRVDAPELERADARREPLSQPVAVEQPARLRIGADEAGWNLHALLSSPPQRSARYSRRSRIAVTLPLLKWRGRPSVAASKTTLPCMIPSSCGAFRAWPSSCRMISPSS